MELHSSDADVAAIFDEGLQAHNAGDLNTAEKLYQEAVSIQPDHCEANHNIGMLLAAKNELDEALKFFKYALDSSPNVSLFWASYISVLIKLGRIVESKTLMKAVRDAGISCEKIEAISQHLEIEHQEPEAKNTQELDELIVQQKFDDAKQKCLSLIETYPSSAALNINLGKCYSELGQTEQAIACYKKAAKYQPQWVASYILLGQLYSSHKKPDQAIECLNKAIELQPDNPELYSALSAELLQDDKADQAIECLKKAVKLNPNDATSYFNMGIMLQAEDNFKAAIESYQKSVSIQPDNAEAFNNMGVLQNRIGNPDAALTNYQRAIQINPDYANAYENKGNALKDKGDQDASIKCYQQALLIRPSNADAYFNMGIAQRIKGDLDEAITSFKRALKINPEYAEVYYYMGVTYTNIGNLDAAITNYKQAVKLNPDCESARVQQLHLQAHICDWASIVENHTDTHNLGTLNQHVDPFALLAMEDAPLRHRLRSEVFATNCSPNDRLSLRRKPTQKPNRLRIGYFSADFHNHATLYLMARLFEAHDSTKFEIYAYSFGPDDNGKMRQRLVKAVDVFRDVREISDKDISWLAQKDKLDIAVDLKGYTQHGRPGIFYYRAAPIQISYLGYPGTTGAAAMDYIIADKVVIPKQFETAYSESIIHLPHSYQVNDNTRVISASTPTKSEIGLPENGFIFCCFNSNYKISPSEFNIWMRLLTEVKGSVLWLLRSNQWAERNLRVEAENRGISATRLVFAEPIPQAEHLARLKLADLFIDTFNVNAHTTASDALWAGLPVITKLGNGFPARVAGSLLTAIDLPELITENEQEYEALILKLATNPERFLQIKEKLALSRLSKPLFNTELFTKHLENGYQQAYDRYFNGEKPGEINVPVQLS